MKYATIVADPPWDHSSDRLALVLVYAWAYHGWTITECRTLTEWARAA